jgi:RND superfamily putative drug exporter
MAPGAQPGEPPSLLHAQWEGGAMTHPNDRDNGQQLPTEPAAADRRAAHERLSTGAWSSWIRMCATHPWRVVLGWVAIIVVLIGLVSTIGGSLRDKFEIPGSDTQKATDLIESKFTSEQGSVLNLVFAAPAGQRLDTPARRAAIEKAVAQLKTPEFKPANGKAGLESVGDPFDKSTFAKNGRIAYAEAQFDQTIEDKDRDAVVAVEDAVRQRVEPAGVTVEYNGEAEFPPIEQGTSEALGLLAAMIVLLIVFRAFTAMLIPIALALTALVTAFLLLFILAGLTDINTITPILVSMIGLGVGIDYSLLVVTRYRTEVRAGLDRDTATEKAIDTAGRTVMFAAITVVIALLGLLLLGLNFMQGVALGAATAVLAVMLSALTIIPALIEGSGPFMDGVVHELDNRGGLRLWGMKRRIHLPGADWR